MNYIYDIYLNFNEILYDFFDWNKNDKLFHIKKIPVFKADEDTIKNLINNTIKISEDILCQIYNRTDVWNMSDKITYSSLFTDGNSIIAIEFDKSGKSIRKSYLCIDEELEVLEIVDRLKEREIEYKIVKKEKSLLKTRKEINEEKFVNHELKNIEDKKLIEDKKSKNNDNINKEIQ